MNDAFKMLRNLNESMMLLEYDRKDLKKWAGDDLTLRFFAIRNKLQAPEDDLSYWIKKGDLLEFEDTIVGWESGKIKSKSQKKKDEKINGADLIYSDKNWKVYRVTTYEAASILGSNTTWCITGRYQGHEDRGKYWFNNYINSQNLDGGYYFFFNLNKRDSTTGDYEKYCIGVTKDKRLAFIYNGMLDSDITNTGIPYISPENLILPIKGVKIPYYISEKIKDGVLVLFNFGANITEYTVPEGVISIGPGAFSPRHINTPNNLRTIILPSTLKSIGIGAFLSNTSLRFIKFNPGLEKIEKGAFFGCNKLINSTRDSKLLELPDSLKYIGSLAFGYCTNLKYIYIPENTEIDSSAFDYTELYLISSKNPAAIKIGNLRDIDVINPSTGEFLNSQRSEFDDGEITENLTEAKASNIDELYKELKELEDIMYNGDINDLYNMSFDEFSETYPVFTKDCLLTYIRDIEILEPEQLNDKSAVDEYWRSGELIIPSDWNVLLDGARRMVTTRIIKGIQWEKILKKYSNDWED